MSLIPDWSNPLYRCVGVEQRGRRVTVLERNRLTGHYRQREIEF